jgi:hypothetical protein
MNYTRPFIIFSGMKPTNTAMENTQIDAEIVDLFKTKNLDYVEVEGHYDGCRELSYLVGYGHEPLIRRLCTDFGQESYLLVDANGYGSLRSPEGEHLAELGKWKEVDSVKGLNNYSTIKDRHWVCR